MQNIFDDVGGRLMAAATGIPGARLRPLQRAAVLAGCRGGSDVVVGIAAGGSKVGTCSAITTTNPQAATSLTVKFDAKDTNLASGADIADTLHLARHCRRTSRE